MKSIRLFLSVFALLVCASPNSPGQFPGTGGAGGSSSFGALTGSPSDNANFSTTGGANKVPQFDSLGNLKLSALRPFADAGATIQDGGNLILTDRQLVGWYASDGAPGGPTGYGEMLFRIRQANDHPFETNIDARGNLCFYWGETFGNKQLQLGNINGGEHFITLMSGVATGGTTTRNAVPIYARTSYWNGSAATENYLGMQATVASTGKVGWRFYKNANRAIASENAFVTGAEFADLSEDGLASPGQAPVADTLSSAAPIQTCSKYKTVQFAKLELTASRTLVISGAVSGMRGVIYVKQGGSGSYTLTLPGGSTTQTGFSLSTAVDTSDKLEWEYDGTFYYWSITKGFSVLYAAADSDAAAYIAAVEAAKGSTMTSVQRGAIDQFVIAEKAASRWTLHKRLYLPIWANAGANAIDLKTLAVGTFPNSAAHGAGYVQGNGTNQYFDFGVTPGALGLTTSDVLLTALLKAMPTTSGNRAAVGCANGADYMSFSTESGSSNFYANLCTFNATSWGFSQLAGLYTVSRNTTQWEMTRNFTGFGFFSHVNTGATVGNVPAANLRAMAISATVHQSDAQLGFYGASQHFTPVSAYSANVKTLWETCTGLTLPN